MREELVGQSKLKLGERLAYATRVSLLLGVACLMGGLNRTAASSSAHYGLAPTDADFGGRAATSVHYANASAIEDLARTDLTSTDYSVIAGYIGAVTDFLGGAVWAEWVFYNGSSWDGNDMTANSRDDQAIASDKIPLRPGGTAKFANYTSYNSGLNGIMVDIPALPGTPTPADLTFRTGNDNTPSAWSTASAPNVISVRAGAGTNGSDRVTLIWTNNAVRKQWLEITVLPSANTGLAVPDVFYFGNAVAESGNSTTDARVDIFDENAARIHPRTFLNPPLVSDPYDYNRDKRVDIFDENLARINATTFLNALRLIHPAASSPANIANLSESVPLAGSVHIAASQRSLLESAVDDAAALVLPSSNSAEALFQLSRTADGNLVLVLRAPSNASLVLQTATQLVADNWVTESEVPAGHSIRWVIQGSDQERFFRLRVQ